MRNTQRADQRGRSTDRLEEIVKQVRRGRVRRLFVALGVRVWGTVDPTTGQVRTRGKAAMTMTCSMNETVFMHGGDVIALSRNRMPGGREAVAELR